MSSRALALAPSLRPAVALVAALGPALAGCESDAKLSRQNERPLVDVLGPVESDVFRLLGPDVPLRGQVSDEYDLPDQLTVVWVLADGTEVPVDADADGLVSLDLPVDGFDLGVHQATLLVTDTDGWQNSAPAAWRVEGPLGAPTAQIVSPYDGAIFPVGSSVTLQGLGQDLTTPAADLAFAWSSDLAGPLPGEISADGRSVLVTDLLGEGTHQITLTVTDADLESGSATISVVIGEEEEDPIIDDTEPVDAEPGDLVFSEMMVNPEAVADEVGEWVEMYNTSGSPIDISGYSFHDDDIDGWVMAGVVIPPNSYAVLCANVDPRVNGGVPCDGWFFRDWEGAGLALANGPDELVLTRPDGVEIDWLYYDDTWFTRAVATGVDPDFVESGANNDGRHWCDQQTRLSGMLEIGTPGVENDHCD